MAIHVRTDDVHFFGVRLTYFCTVNFLARATLARLRIERAELFVRLTERIGIDAGGAAHAARTRSSGQGVRVVCDRRPAWQLRVGGKIRVFEPRSIRTTITFELSLDPIDGGPIAIGTLAAIAEQREAFDRGLVFLEVEAPHQGLDRIAALVGLASRAGRGRRVLRQRHRSQDETRNQCRRKVGHGYSGVLGPIHAPSNVPTPTPISAQNCGGGCFSPSAYLSLNTSICPPCALMQRLRSPTDAIAPMSPAVCENLRKTCLRTSNSCSFLPFNSVQAPGAGSQPRMRLKTMST